MKHTYKTFSLVELVIVITILGVLASILLFSVGGIFESSYETSIRGDLNSLAEFMETKALDEAGKRKGNVRFYRVGTTTADAFCDCTVGGTCSTKTLEEIEQIQTKYAADGVGFHCKTGNGETQWAAALIINDNGPLGDLGTNTSLTGSTPANIITHKIYCVSKTNTIPIQWVVDAGVNLNGAAINSIFDINNVNGLCKGTGLAATDYQKI